MTKIEKEFLLSDDSVNCYGYRLLTEGLQLERFNPAIGYLMHDREKGVAVKWEDLVVRNSALYGKPVVNDELFPELVTQIQEGFYAAASVGHIVALEWSDEPGMKLEGQTGPTVTKWFPRECSIVDIPGNYNAVAQLFAEDDTILHDLSANLTTIFMNKTTIEMEVLLAAGLPNLAADSTPEQVTEVVRDLVAKAERCDAAEQELADLRAEMQSLQEKVNDEKIQSIISQALADHKMTPAMSEQLQADYKGRPDALKALVDTMPAQTTINSQLTATIPAEIAGKTYKELYDEGKLEMVKQNYPDHYAAIRKTYLGE
jgi:hypothetical protein